MPVELEDTGAAGGVSAHEGDSTRVNTSLTPGSSG